MQIKISEDTDTILKYARDEAMRTGSLSIEADHLLLATLRHEDNGACRVLKALGVDLSDLKAYLDSCLFRGKMVPYAQADDIVVSRIAHNVINMAAYEALKVGVNVLSPLHLLLSLSRSTGSLGREYLEEHGLGTKELSEYMEKEGLLVEKPQQETQVKNLPLSYVFVTTANPKYKS